MKYTRLSLKSLAITAAGCALLGVSATAFAVPILKNPQPFTIQEDGIPGSNPQTFVADRFAGSYNEVFTADTATTFTAKSVFSLGNYALGANGAIGSQLNSTVPGDNHGYGLYALLESSGTFTTSPSGVVSFTGTSNQIKLWADPKQDTTATVPTTSASAPFSLPGAGEDVLLGKALTGFGTGSFDSTAQAPGNFGIYFPDFTLTPDGKGYFIDPVPFYVRLQANGNFNPFDVPQEGDTFTIQGAANGYFAAVPGPGSLGLAMLGIALLGLGVITKRSRSSKGV